MKIEDKRMLGYEPISASVTYKVRWFDRDNEVAYWILLPKIFFRKIQEVNVINEVLETNNDNVL